MKKAVIFDIDGVLAQKSPDRDYREYDKVGLDSPIKHTFELLNYYCKDTDNVIIFITGRKQYSLEKTLIWLKIHACHEFDVWDELGIFDVKLFMRGDKDHRPSDVLKKEIYEVHVKDKYDVVAVYDDDIKNCEMFRGLGLNVFHVMLNL